MHVPVFLKGLAARITIKTLLIVWALVGITAALGLAATGFSTGDQLANSLNGLVSGSLPQESASRALTHSVLNLAVRQELVAAAANNTELENFSERRYLEKSYQEARDNLGRTLAHSEDIIQSLATLDSAYQEFLEADGALLVGKRSLLDLQQQQRSLVKELDNAVEQVDVALETINGRVALEGARVRFRLRQTLEGDNKNNSPLRVLAEKVSTGQQVLLQQMGAEIRLGVTKLASLGRKIVLTLDQDILNDLKNNQMVEAIAITRGALEVVSFYYPNDLEQVNQYQVLKKSVEKLIAILTEGENPIYVLRKNEIKELRELSILMSRAQNAVTLVMAALEKIEEIIDSEGMMAISKSNQVIVSSRVILLSVTLPLILIMIVMSWLVGGRVMRGLNQVIGYFQSIGAGRYDNPIETTRQDEIGRMFLALRDMQGKLAWDVSEARRVAQESLRVKNALDHASTGVFIADRENKIVYANRAVLGLFTHYEEAIQRDLPGFRAAALLGMSLADLQPDTIAYENTADRALGSCTFRVTISPVYDEDGEQLGSSVEWRDITGEVAIQEEVKEVVGAALAGDFNQRLKLEGKEGFMGQLSADINRLTITTAEAIEATVAALAQVADGNLTTAVQYNYGGAFGRIRDYTNRTIHQLTHLLGNIQQAAGAIHRTAQEIAQGNQALSVRTESQAASQEQASATMEELTATVQQNAQAAQNANRMTGIAAQTAAKGGQVVKEAVATMAGVQQSSQQIRDISRLIDTIAFQTNILALNAAVEAARAGEQGRGFAVVASEVRNLASRSATAAREIGGLINDSVSRIHAGTQLVQQAGESMEAIVTSVAQVKSMMEGISIASQEQSIGIQQANQVLLSMGEATQANAVLVEQAAAAAESLKHQAHVLRDQVGAFRLAS